MRRALSHGVTLERVSPTSDQGVDDVYSRMIAVELASWKGIEQCGMAEPGPKKFYEVMMKYLAATGDARIIFAKHGGKDIGFIFGGLTGGIYRGQQFSYDEEWQSSSIGNILQMEQVDWSCEEGLTRYDMGPLEGPRMSYKTHWTERKHSIETWVLDRS
jgi:CelD/BcsL family acetyltransferase involved in cellulose biosynthesis